MRLTGNELGMNSSLAALTLKSMNKRLLAAVFVTLALVPQGAGRIVAEAHAAELESAESAFPSSELRSRASVGPAEYPVVVVAIDGTRPREIFEGEEPRRVGKRRPKSAVELMPNLHAMASEGRLLGHEEPVTASGPNFVSLPGYTEMFAGAKAVHCTTNDCGRTRVPTVVDAVTAHGLRAAVVTSWERICLAATVDGASLDASCGRHGGHLDTEGDEILDAMLARAASEGPGPGHDDYRSDARTAEIALRVVDTKHPDFLFVGLGDTDEHAHMGNYEGYVAALGHADDFLGRLRTTLDAQGERGRNTTIFVVTDHGRSEDFRNHGGAYAESRHGFMMVSGPRVPQKTGPGVAVTLSDVGRGAARVLGLPTEYEPSTFTRWVVGR